LLSQLEPHFSGSTQVRRSGLDTSGDEAIWRHAKEHGFAILTKDADFSELKLIARIPTQSDLVVLWQHIEPGTND
jgi:predicted nuclease of predicted toxin-antitoxin system